MTFETLMMVGSRELPRVPDVMFEALMPVVTFEPFME